MLELFTNKNRLIPGFFGGQGWAILFSTVEAFNKVKENSQWTEEFFTTRPCLYV